MAPCGARTASTRSSSALAPTGWSPRSPSPTSWAPGAARRGGRPGGRSIAHRGADPARLPARRRCHGAAARPCLAGVPGAAARGGRRRVGASAGARGASARRRRRRSGAPRRRRDRERLRPRRAGLARGHRRHGPAGEPLVDTLLSPLGLPHAPFAAARYGDRWRAAGDGPRPRCVPDRRRARRARRDGRALGAQPPSADHRGVRHAARRARAFGRLAGGARRVAGARRRPRRAAAPARRRDPHRDPGR